MATLNKVFLILRLGQEPEKRVNANGTSFCNISGATTDYGKDANGNKTERTDWHRLVFAGKKADLVTEYCHKGSQLFIEGSLQTRDWEDKDGNKRQTVEIFVREMQFLDSKKGSSHQPQQSYQQGNAPMHNTPPDQGGGGCDDSDIPFMYVDDVIV